MVTPATHLCYLVEVARHVYCQDLDRDLGSFVFTFPHVGVTAAIQRSTHSIIAEWDLRRPREQGLTTAYLTQSSQTLPPKPWFQAIQRLLDKIGKH